MLTTAFTVSCAASRAVTATEAAVSSASSMKATTFPCTWLSSTRMPTARASEGVTLRLPAPPKRLSRLLWSATSLIHLLVTE